ncbi:hypothetical protein BH10CYA1_BH10CYA1_42680 [soil metagenome]
MKTRRRQGATLGLVAVCVLVIIVIGIGCFFLAKIFGGGREVANATDAGALNIAKNAMNKTNPLISVSLPGASGEYADFVALADPPSSNTINLLTYNRCVAQALIVAMNAQQEGTPTAATHAGNVISALNQLGSALKAKLTNPALVQYFGAVNNDTRMWGNTGLNAQASTYKTAFMKHNESTNIYLTPSLFNHPPVNLATPSNFESVGLAITPQLNPAVNNAYLKGYFSLNVPGIGSVMGVPVFPQQNPHLVALADFNNPATSAAPSGTVPPNAFSVAASSTEAKTGVLGGAIAAAIVGSSVTKANNGGAANYDFPASVPGGYLAIVNLPSATLPAGGIAVPNDDNIFNNELYLGPGIDITSTSSGAAYNKTDMSASAAWAAYNNSSSSNPDGGLAAGSGGTFVADARGKNGNLYPPSRINGTPIPLNDMYTASTPNGVAQNPPDLAALLTITSPGQNCLDQMNTGPNFYLSGQCLTYLPSFLQTFNRPMPSGGAGSTGLFTAVDLAKGQVIAAFQSGARGVTVTGSTNQGIAPSGLGLYANGVSGAYPQPSYNPNGSIQTLGNIDQLLTQVTTGNQLVPSCSKTNIIKALTQRCYEIKPNATPAEIAALWQTPLPIGQTAYIYIDPATKNLKAFGQAQAPQTLVANSQPDGAPLDPQLNCESDYSLDNGMVDVAQGSSNAADDNLHDRPYSNWNGSLHGQDHATLILSSGFNNLLGQLSFSNTTSGVENFSRPN